MTKKQIFEYGLLYQPYSRNLKWVEWFTKVAPLKVERALKIIQKYKKGNAKVLDYGCGVGFNIYYFAKSFPDIVGIDIDKKSVESAQKQLKKLKCYKKILHYDGKKLPFKNKSFDIVNANDVWEHTENPQLMLKEIKRVLKTDGILFINTPNKLWPLETHYKLPLLSYLPYSIANWYVRIANKADRYDDIHLATYGEFKKSIEEFFVFKDTTFDLIKNYKKNKLQNERGILIPIVGTLLKFLDVIKDMPVVFIFYSLSMYVLNRVSIGWVFICWPKK